MEFEKIHALLLERFGPDIITGKNSEAIDPWIEVSAADLAEVCQFLKNDERLRFDHLNDLTVVDYLEPDPKKAARFPFQPHLEVVYHLTSYETRSRIVMKVPLPRWKDDFAGELPEVPSVADLWPAANWHEREAYDLLGVRFAGHPDHRRILMPEDWSGHPLRKDYVWAEEYQGIRTQ